MKPVAIFRNSPTEGPGYFSAYLDRRGIAWRLILLDAGEPVPGSAQEFGGLCLMGGPMSANDDLPWVAPVLELIRDATRRDVPVIGHCLGGQLMARALGGTVSRSAVKEIGWGRVDVMDESIDESIASQWFGAVRHFKGFHWHGETFSIPPGATRIAASAWCENQAFVMGRNLALQYHVEMTAELVRAWCAEWGSEVDKVRSDSIQTPQQMLAGLDDRLEELHRVADGLYDRWVEGLAR